MKKTTLLIILGVVTVGCIIIGSIKHIGGGIRAVRNSGLLSWDDDSPKESKFSFHWDNDSDNPDFSIEKEFEKFKSIKINSSVMEIKIQQGDNYKVSGSWSKDWLRPEVDVKNGELEIKQPSRKHPNSGNNYCRMTITIPAAAELKDIDIDSNVGEINIREIDAGDVNIQLNVGEISMHRVTFGNVIIDNNVGEVTVDAEMNLDDYAISLSTDVGEVNVDNKRYKRSYSQSGNSKKKIEINTNVGEINLNQASEARSSSSRKSV